MLTVLTSRKYFRTDSTKTSVFSVVKYIFLPSFLPPCLSLSLSLSLSLPLTLSRPLSLSLL